MAALSVTMAAYVAYRMTQRQTPFVQEDDYDAVPYAPVMATGSAFAAELAQEIYIENASEIEENQS